MTPLVVPRQRPSYVVGLLWSWSSSHAGMSSKTEQAIDLCPLCMIQALSQGRHGWYLQDVEDHCIIYQQVGEWKRYQTTKVNIGSCNGSPTTTEARYPDPDPEISENHCLPESQEATSQAGSGVSLPKRYRKTFLQTSASSLSRVINVMYFLQQKGYF